MPPKETIKTAYDVFLDKGLVGAVALLAIAGLIWAVTRLLKSKDDRIKDHGDFATTLQKIGEVLTATTIEVNKSATAAQAEAGRTTMVLNVSVQNLEKSVQTMTTELGALRDEQVRVAASLSSGGSRGRAR